MSRGVTDMPEAVLYPKQSIFMRSDTLPYTLQLKLEEQLNWGVLLCIHSTQRLKRNREPHSYHFVPHPCRSALLCNQQGTCSCKLQGCWHMWHHSGMGSGHTHRHLKQQHTGQTEDARAPEDSTIINIRCTAWMCTVTKDVFMEQFDELVHDNGWSLPPFSQLSPVHPLGHWQLWPPGVLVQVPPFWQGEALHSSTSVQTNERPAGWFSQDVLCSWFFHH